MPESEALVRLWNIKRVFAKYIHRTCGHLAADCSVCQIPCCIDAQFVNVNISRLEAVAMVRTLEASPRYGPQKVAEVLRRAQKTVETYGLTEIGDTFAKTYACPLYEPGTGCLVHWKAKPAPCIQHGCFEQWQDVPEIASMRRVERYIDRLNEQVYREPTQLMTIPVWFLRVLSAPTL